MIDGKKKINFGASGYSGFTKHGDTDRKDRYIARHKRMRVGQNLGQKVLGFIVSMYFGIGLL